MTVRRLSGLFAAALFCAGCFTIDETEVPAVRVSSLPQGKTVKLQVSGFAATVTQLVPIYGSQTYFTDHGPGPGGHGRWGGPHLHTVTTETLVPQSAVTDAYLVRAQNLFEDAGFLLRVTPADYTVETTFSGPFVTEGERRAETICMLCSIFSAEYAVQTWNAKLRIYDAKSGRVVFTRDIAQKYEYSVWSPLFFIGLAGVTKNDFNYMQNWCLAVLTDRVCAEAAAFLAK